MCFVLGSAFGGLSTQVTTIKPRGNDGVVCQAGDLANARKCQDAPKGFEAGRTRPKCDERFCANQNLTVLNDMQPPRGILLRDAECGQVGAREVHKFQRSIATRGTPFINRDLARTDRAFAIVKNAVVLVFHDAEGVAQRSGGKPMRRFGATKKPRVMRGF